MTTFTFGAVGPAFSPLEKFQQKILSVMAAIPAKLFVVKLVLNMRSNLHPNTCPDLGGQICSHRTSHHLAKCKQGALNRYINNGMNFQWLQPLLIKGHPSGSCALRRPCHRAVFCWSWWWRGGRDSQQESCWTGCSCPEEVQTWPRWMRMFLAVPARSQTPPCEQQCQEEALFQLQELWFHHRREQGSDLRSFLLHWQ